MLGVKTPSGIVMRFGKTRQATESRWLAASLFGAVFGAVLAMLAAPASASILITIDKSAQQMSVAVDGAQRYVWPVSTGRPGYDTPSGSFKPNRMDADHYSQEWDNAPMPHAIFFDMDGHAIHGFFDVKHLGRAVSHGCVRLSPDHAQTLFNLVKAQGIGETKVVVAGHTPSGDNAPVARSRLPLKETVSSEPVQVAPGYGRESSPYSGDRASGQPSYGQPAYDQSYQPGYAQRPYARPYQGQSYYGQSNYAQPGYASPSYPPQPPPAYGPPGYWQR
jgi:hypothetical protein